MAEKRKPQEDLVKLAGRAMTHPEQVTGSEIKRMAARILDDQKNDPEPSKTKPSIASQVIAKVGDLLPEALKSDEKNSTKSPAKSKAAPAASKAAPAGKSEPAPAPKPAGKAKAALTPPEKPMPAPKAVTAPAKKSTPKSKTTAKK